MQQRMVVHELHVTGSKTHQEVQTGIVGQRVETIQSLHMQGREPHRIGEPLGGIDILTLID